MMKRVNRRQMIKAGAACLASVVAKPLDSTAAAAKQSRPAAHHPAGVIDAPDVALPDGQSLPFGWDAFAIPPATRGEAAVLSWKREGKGGGEARLRMSVAVDVRDKNQVEARPDFVPDSRRVFVGRGASQQRRRRDTAG